MQVHQSDAGQAVNRIRHRAIHFRTVERRVGEQHENPTCWFRCAVRVSAALFRLAGAATYTVQA